MSWQEWSVEECNHHYSPTEWCQRFSTPEEVIDDYIARCKEGSSQAKATVCHEEGISTGWSDDCKVDIFYPNDAKSSKGLPVFIYIHGGWWQMGSRSESSWMAPCFTKAGAVVVVFGYTLTPHTSMSDIVQQITTSTLFTLHWAKRNEASGVYIAGHSAGAHLSAMMGTVKWVEEHMASASVIKGFILLGGIYDLAPFAKTKYNDAVKLTDEDVCKFSPIRLEPAVKHCPYWLVYGEHEGPEFYRHAKDYHKVLQASGVESREVCVQGCDHMDLVLNLTNPDYSLTKELFQLMGCVSHLVQEMEIKD